MPMDIIVVSSYSLIVLSNGDAKYGAYELSLICHIASVSTNMIRVCYRFIEPSALQDELRNCRLLPRSCAYQKSSVAVPA